MFGVSIVAVNGVVFEPFFDSLQLCCRVFGMFVVRLSICTLTDVLWLNGAR